jgi:transposase
MRPHGSPEELARRRQRAVAAYHAGQSPTTIAKVLGVDRTTIHRWVRLARTPGGLEPIPLRRTPRLSDQQLAHLEDLLLQGASKHGWATELWTATRVAVMIQRHFGFSYHAEHVRGNRQALQAEQRSSYLNRIGLSWADWQAGSVSRADQVLDDCLPALRSWEWHYLKRLCHAELLALPGHGHSIRCLAFCPDGKRRSSAPSPTRSRQSTRR